MEEGGGLLLEMVTQMEAFLSKSGRLENNNEDNNNNGDSTDDDGDGDDDDADREHGTNMEGEDTHTGADNIDDAFTNHSCGSMVDKNHPHRSQFYSKRDVFLFQTFFF